MTAQISNHIEEVLPQDIKLLTQLLSLAPGQEPNTIWLQYQATYLSVLPSSLLQPSSIIPHLAIALPISNKARLCKTHKVLNAYLIHDLFLSIRSEVSARQTTLEQNTHLSDILRDHLIRVHSFASLWMTPTNFQSTYLTQPLDQQRKRMNSGCKACILAAIGGNHTILSDLRASLLGRKKKAHPQEPLLPFVEAWIEWTGRGEVIRVESDVVMKEIRRCRRRMQKARRQMSAHGGGEEDTETECSPFINRSEQAAKVNGDDLKEIIDLYADREGNGGFEDENVKVLEGVHPAFCDSVFFNETAGTFERVVPESLKPRKYSASVYSQEEPCGASFRDWEERNTDELHQLLSARAQAYRRLMGDGMYDENEVEDGRRSRMTYWADICSEI